MPPMYRMTSRATSWREISTQCERAARRATVKPLGEALDVGRVAEEGAGELERLGGRQAVEVEVRALTAQRDEARGAPRFAPDVLGDDEQDRVLLRELRERHEETEARVVRVVDVVDRDDERLDAADLREPRLEPSAGVDVGVGTSGACGGIDPLAESRAPTSGPSERSVAP